MPRLQSRFARAAKARRRRPPSKAQRLARSPRLPRAAELAMALVLRQGIERLGRVVLGMPLERYAKQDAQRTDAADGSGPEIPGGDAIVRGIRFEVSGHSKGVADKVKRHSESEFKRLGIDLRKEEPKFGKLIDGWRKENAERAESLVGFERDKLAEILDKGWGKSVPELRQRIEERLEVSRSKADLLARDQVLKLNANITRERHKAAGITEYIWTTSRDERVRSAHEELDGETFEWDDPPVTNDAGDTNHPGEDYQCRCIAFPVLPELDDEEPAGADEEPEPEKAPEPEPIPFDARRDELIAALGNPEGVQGAVVRNIIREQIGASLPGAVSKDTRNDRANHSTITVDDARMLRLGAEAVHDWDGNVIVQKAALTGAYSALALHRAKLPVTYEQRDHVSTLLHEELHGHSRFSPGSYSGIGAKLEEVGTELNARRITGEVFGVPIENRGAYQHWIESVRGAVGRGLATRLDDAALDRMVADAHVRGTLVDGKAFASPRDALEAFAGALPVTAAERAAIIRNLEAL